MIAACPKCKARYRIDREKLRDEGVRLRCSRCEAVFRVRPPAAASPAPPQPATPAESPASPAGVAASTPAGASTDSTPVGGSAESTPVGAPPSPDAMPAGAPASLGSVPEGPPASAVSSPPPASPEVSAPAAAQAPSEPGPAPATPDAPSEPGPDAPCIGVALPDADLGKQVADTLAARGLRSFVVHDGVEAMLEIQRQLPVAVVLSATLPKMYGFQVCEVVKRNPSLCGTQVILAGAIHHKDRYRRPPDDLYGADAYVEEPDLPDGLLPILDRALAGRDLASDAGPEPVRAAEPLQPAPSVPAPVENEAPPPAAAPPAAPADDGLEEERAKAERLARIIVSDIVLYNEERFTEAVRVGNVVEALAAEIAEGRALFVERVDERVRDERDHLADELVRVARARGMA